MNLLRRARLLISKEDLVEAARQLIGRRDLKALSLDEITVMMTITQFITDWSLREIEDRGELTFRDGVPIVPYASNYVVDTIVTRGGTPLAPRDSRLH